MTQKIFSGLAVMVFLLTGVVLFGAKEYQIRQFGDPKTAFYVRLHSVDDLRKMVRSTRSDIQDILQQRRWSGRMEDLIRAVESGNVSETRIPPGTRMPFIAMRRDGRPHVIENVVWVGQGDVDTYVVEFVSNESNIRLYVPKICANFWIEERPIERPAAAAAQPARPAAPASINVQGADVCLGQPIRLSISVANPPAGSTVVITIDGKRVSSYPAKSGTSRRRYSPFQLGSHPVVATLNGITSQIVVEVRNCQPTCVLVPTRTLTARGLVFGVDASGSTVGPGAPRQIQSVDVTVSRDGTEAQKFEMRAPVLQREDLQLTEPGDYTINAVAVDEAGNRSQNVCSVQYAVPRKPKSLFFVGGFVGKERLVQDEVFAARCDPIVGIKGGILHGLNKNVEVELALGAKLNLDNGDDSSLFADAALNRVFERGFVGGGVSFWDINESRTRAAALLVQLGFDVHRDRRVQFVIEARAPFDRFDDLGNNYQVWAGFRFRPGR